MDATKKSEGLRARIQGEMRKQQPLKQRFAGWRGSLILGSIISMVVLLFNVGFAGWAAQRNHLQGAQGVLYEGDCTTVKNAGIGFHLLINIFSTALLSASNYCMQCLCAPTRHDVDIAHQNGQWLDIGVSSLRNIFRISKKRSWLWMCLVVSSVPLHLVYNSTIFTSISANAYDVFAGNGELNGTALTYLNPNVEPDGSRDVFLRLNQKANNGTLNRLENDACVNAYATAYQSVYGSLVIVTDDITPANHYDHIYTQTVFNPANEAVQGASGFNWICQDLQKHEFDWEITPCISFLPQVREQVASSNWTVAGHKVDHCLAEKVTPHCKLQYSLPLVLIVIVFNLVKIITLGYVAITWTDAPILTTGDAVASFLRTPDQFSRGMCLLSVDAVRRPAKHDGQATFDENPIRWKQAVSSKRWGVGIGCYVTALLACIALLALGLTLNFDSTGIWSVGLGQVSTSSLISSGGYWVKSVVANSVLANLPQLIFSALYFAFNGILTTMALAHEWSQHAIQRKGLRVSSRPIGAQRSNYFLSLPYRYAIPFIISSTLIHWLISESLFLVVIEAFKVTLERDPEVDVTTCGYSAVAIVATVALGAVALSTVIGLSYRRFKSGMPVAGSCSLAIAAACHPSPSLDDLDASSLPLQWGVVHSEGGDRHCAFSSLEVTMPQHGWVYGNSESY